MFTIVFSNGQAMQIPDKEFFSVNVKEIVEDMNMKKRLNQMYVFPSGLVAVDMMHVIAFGEAE